MFSVIISEKGGAERREIFDRTEINVGRVQGNDLMLPKGNVSKRHARLLYRDGRFIVTDLKSTNGTYVNGRKIAQATIVREGDKIYIGDFILRIEASATGSAPGAQPDGQPAPLPTHMEPSDPAPAAPRDQVPGPLLEPLQHGTIEPAAIAAPPSSAERGPGLAPQVEARIDLARTGGQVISHFPLENDPDDSGPDAPVPGPPRVPSPRPAVQAHPTLPGMVPGTPPPAATRPSGTSFQVQARTTPAAPGVLPIERTTPREPLPGPAARRHTDEISAVSPLPAAGSTSSSSPSLQAVSPRRSAPMSERSDRLQQSEPGHAAARQRALGRLVDRVGAVVDLRPLSGGAPLDEHLTRRIEASLAEASAGMRASGELPPDVDGDAVVADARRELLQLGPIDPLLGDDDVSEIQVFRHDHVVATHGRRTAPLSAAAAPRLVLADVAFSSETAVARAIRRLCALSGEPLREGEAIVERRLPRGARLLAVLPPAAGNGHALVIRKPQRADLTLDDLVRSGTISRGMAGLLSQCVGGRANVLVTGARGSGAEALLGALAAVGSPDDRIVVLQDEDDLALHQAHAVSIPLGETAETAARAVRTAARLRPDRLIVRAFAGRAAAEVIEAIGEGMIGVLAVARAPALRQGVARLAADIAAARPGLSLEAAREWLAAAFDLVIEIARLRDGRLRVLRVAELHAEGGQLSLRDVFTFSVERTAAGGALEGTFHPSGVIPAIVEDLGARGVTVDTAPLRRTR